MKTFQSLVKSTDAFSEKYLNVENMALLIQINKRFEVYIL
jgi:hypothetical protein